MRMNDITLLFINAGRRVELLRAFRASFQKLDIQGRIIATDLDALAPALQVADEALLFPHSRDSDFVSTLTAVCAKRQVKMVIPLIDPDLSRLAQARAEIEATGARLLLSPLKAVLTTNDKWETMKFFQGLGLATPRSWLPDEIEAIPDDYPLFIKPRNGSASEKTFRVNSRAELEFFINYVPNPIVQEWMPGPEVTVDVICDLDGDLMGVVQRQRIQVRGGEVNKGETVRYPELEEAAVKIAHALPALGCATVQCLRKDDVFCFTEINARIGGGAPLAIAAGADLATWLVARRLGIDIQIPNLGAYKIGMYMTRFDDAFFSEQKPQFATAKKVI